MAGNITTVNILVVSLAADTQGNRCLLILDNIWPAGGWMQKMPPGSFDSDYIQAWAGDVAARTAFGGIVWQGRWSTDWILRDVSFPLTAGQKGTGEHKVAGTFVGPGDIAWKIISINVAAPNWELMDFDISEFLTSDDDDS